MSAAQYEEYIARWLQSEGYDVALTQETNDRGIDVIAEDERGVRYAIQAKYYKPGNKVGSPEVQKVSGLLTLPEIDAACIFTTSSFSSEAEKVAENRGVVLRQVDFRAQRDLKKNTRESANSVNEEYIHDPRVQQHQEKAGVSATDEAESQSSSTESIESSTSCWKCSETIPPSRESHIEHWRMCELPDNRPTNIPVDTWWEIKDKVR